MSSSFLKSLVWRRALKHFPSGQVPTTDVNAILEAARLAPSSFGVQPYHIHVVTNNNVKKELAKVSYDQAQVTECSHLLVFTARNDAVVAVERFIKSHDLDKHNLDYATALRQSLSGLDKQSFHSFASNQAFLALGFCLTAAADLKIGSCPMTGFVPDGVREVLKLNANETPVAYLALGMAPTDEKSEKLANPHPKLRLSLSDIVKNVE